MDGLNITPDAISAMVAFLSALIAVWSVFYNKQQQDKQNIEAEADRRSVLTIEFYKLWMSSEMYSARTQAAGSLNKLVQENGRGEKIQYSNLAENNVQAWEQIGRVIHFISELEATQDAELLDRSLVRRLFGTTLIEWDKRLQHLTFPNEEWYKEFDERRKRCIATLR